MSKDKDKSKEDKSKGNPPKITNTDRKELNLKLNKEKSDSKKGRD